MAVLLLAILCSSLFDGTPIPDPCKLVTVTELEEMVGKISKGPKPAEPGSREVSCEYKVAKDSSWLMIHIQQGNFALMRGGFGGKFLISVPELTKDAFLNESYEDFSAELFAKKRDIILRVSMPKDLLLGPRSSVCQESLSPSLAISEGRTYVRTDIHFPI